MKECAATAGHVGVDARGRYPAGHQRKWLRVDSAGNLSYVAVNKDSVLYLVLLRCSRLIRGCFCSSQGGQAHAGVYPLHPLPRPSDPGSHGRLFLRLGTIA
jgi:hypothetical protein